MKGFVCLVILLSATACSDGGANGEPNRDSGTAPDSGAELADAANDSGKAGDSGDAHHGADSTDGELASDGSTDVAEHPVPTSLSAQYPGDDGLIDDPAVLFFDDFEQGWGRWDSPSADTQYLTLKEDGATASSGSHYLQSTVTFEDLEQTQYISAATRYTFDRRVDRVYWRFYARFPNVAPNPHHWVNLSAGDENFNSGGLANTVPAGDEGFWFDFDIANDNTFNFYVYWYLMRSGRCNDGTTTPGCAGDQGTTYHYGNTFSPADQTPYSQDEWICFEIEAQTNTVGQNDGHLAFYINDEEIGRFAPGEPEGTWLRDRFNVGGCEWSACTPPQPFEGFDFRSSEEVRFKKIVMDAYYQRDTAGRKRQKMIDRGLTVSDEQTILYDDVVVATQRIGCRR